MQAQITSKELLFTIIEFSQFNDIINQIKFPAVYELAEFIRVLENQGINYNSVIKQILYQDSNDQIIINDQNDYSEVLTYHFQRFPESELIAFFICEKEIEKSLAFNSIVKQTIQSLFIDKNEQKEKNEPTVIEIFDKDFNMNCRTIILENYSNENDTSFHNMDKYSIKNNQTIDLEKKTSGKRTEIPLNLIKLTDDFESPNINKDKNINKNNNQEKIENKNESDHFISYINNINQKSNCFTDKNIIENLIKINNESLLKNIDTKINENLLDFYDKINLLLVDFKSEIIKQNEKIVIDSFKKNKILKSAKRNIYLNNKIKHLPEQANKIKNYHNLEIKSPEKDSSSQFTCSEIKEKDIIRKDEKIEDMKNFNLIDDDEKEDFNNKKFLKISLNSTEINKDECRKNYNMEKNIGIEKNNYEFIHSTNEKNLNLNIEINSKEIDEIHQENKIRNSNENNVMEFNNEILTHIIENEEESKYSQKTKDNYNFHENSDIDKLKYDKEYSNLINFDNIDPLAANLNFNINKLTLKNPNDRNLLNYGCLKNDNVESEFKTETNSKLMKTEEQYIQNFALFEEDVKIPLSANDISIGNFNLIEDTIKPPSNSNNIQNKKEGSKYHNIKDIFEKMKLAVKKKDSKNQLKDSFTDKNTSENLNNKQNNSTIKDNILCHFCLSKFKNIFKCLVCPLIYLCKNCQENHPFHPIVRYDLFQNKILNQFLWSFRYKNNILFTINENALFQSFKETNNIPKMISNDEKFNNLKSFYNNQYPININIDIIKDESVEIIKNDQREKIFLIQKQIKEKLQIQLQIKNLSKIDLAKNDIYISPLNCKYAYFAPVLNSKLIPSNKESIEILEICLPDILGNYSFEIIAINNSKMILQNILLITVEVI